MTSWVSIELVPASCTDCDSVSSNVPMLVPYLRYHSRGTLADCLSEVNVQPDVIVGVPTPNNKIIDIRKGVALKEVPCRFVAIVVIILVLQASRLDDISCVNSVVVSKML